MKLCTQSSISCKVIVSTIQLTVERPSIDRNEARRVQ